MSNLTQYQPNYTVAPGGIIDEYRETASMTQAELAGRLGLSQKHVNRLLAGIEPVTPETALKLEAVFGRPASLWLNLEARYREALARSSEERALLEEAAWLKVIPYRAIAKLGWIPANLGGVELVRALRSFYGVGSLNYLPNVWGKLQAAYRKSEAFKTQEWALLAWLAQGEREAEQRPCQPLDAAALRAALPELKALSRLSGTDFLAPLISRCAELGVALVLLPAPDGVRACGATRWLAKDKALVQLSLRYKTDDQLWFTLFHEFGHVLLHGKKEQFVDFSGARDSGEAEREADDFAARQLIAPADMARFVAARDFGVAAVEAFAGAQGVAPGIVVGQLQHNRHVPFNSVLSKLKTSFRWPHETRDA